jgi:hypothetical protein
MPCVSLPFLSNIILFLILSSPSHPRQYITNRHAEKKEVHAPWKWFTKFNKPDHHYVQECGYDGKWQTQHWCEEDSVADYCKRIDYSF